MLVQGQTTSPCHFKLSSCNYFNNSKKVHQLFWFSALRRGVKWRVIAKGEVYANWRLHEPIGLTQWNLKETSQTSCSAILKVLASPVWAHGVPEGHPTFSRKRRFCGNSANGLLQLTTVYFTHKSHVSGRKFNEEPKYELENTNFWPPGGQNWLEGVKILVQIFFHKKCLESPETCRKKF